MELIGSFASKPITRQKRRRVIRSRLRSGSAAGKSISSSAVTHIESIFTQPYRANLPDLTNGSDRGENDEAVSFSITQSAESHLRVAGAGAGLREDSGRFDERRSSGTGIPGGQSRRASSGPRRRRRDADGVAGDPRLPRGQDRPPMAGLSRRTR